MDDNPTIIPGSAMAALKAYAQQEQPYDPSPLSDHTGGFRHRGDAAPAAFTALSSLLMLADEREADGLTVLPSEIRVWITTKLDENPR